MSDRQVVVEVTPELIKAARVAFRASLNSESYQKLASAIESGLESVEIEYKGQATSLQTARFKPMIQADKAINKPRT